MSAKCQQETRILLVDDEPNFRNALAFSLKRKGYQVVLASNGREAFDLLQADPVDVVVTDIRMPGGDGIELLNRTREHHGNTPIVLLVTGFAELTTEEAHDKGAEALVAKPFERRALEKIIERLLTPASERWAKPPERVDVNLKIEIRFQSLPEAIEAKVVSLGRGGAFVALVLQPGEFPNVHEAVSFDLVFDGTGSNLKGNGIVRWVRIKDAPASPSGCGIEFTYLGEAERNQILEFLGMKNPKAFIPSR